MIVPGGGLSLDGERWIACRPGFFLPVRVLSRLFRRLVLEKLAAAHKSGALQFFGKHAALTNAQTFAAYLAPLRNREWVVYSKRPFGGPAEVLRYLARYTHRVAISNSRLVALNDKDVTFKWKNYRLEGRERYGVMTLDTHEFIRRFLMHVLPQRIHRIRYYGLLTSPTRANNIARIRALLAVPFIPIDAIKAATTKPDEPKPPDHPCPCCGSRMRIIELFFAGQQPKAPPDPTSGEDPDRHLMTTISEQSPKSRSPAWSLLSRPPLSSLRSYLHYATAAPLPPIHRPAGHLNASPPTSIVILTALLSLAANLSRDPPALKSP
jgi:Putative transposase